MLGGIIIFYMVLELVLLKMNIWLRIILLKGVGWINYSRSRVGLGYEAAQSQKRNKSKSKGLVNFVIRVNSNQ